MGTKSLESSPGFRAKMRVSCNLRRFRVLTFRPLHKDFEQALFCVSPRFCDEHSRLIWNWFDVGSDFGLIFNFLGVRFQVFLFELSVIRAGGLSVDAYITASI